MIESPYHERVAGSPPKDFSLAEALAPFSDEEVDRLRRYVGLAKELKSSRFFQQPQNFEINFNQEGMRFEMPFGEDDEAVTVMVTRLRKLHVPGKPGTASFPHTARLLRAHTDGLTNPSADWFREVLDNRESAVADVTNRSLIGLHREHTDRAGTVVKSETVPPDQPFWDWLYGVYLHDDEDRLKRVKSWADLSPVHRFNFLQMAADLARVLYGFSGIVTEVLEEPGLLPAGVSTA